MQARAEKTRSNILKAARNLFSEHGFAGTSMDSIAIAAKANKQRIYAYFGSKKDLFEAVLLEVFAESAETFEKFSAGIEVGVSNITFELSQYYQSLHVQKPEFQRLLTWANLENAIDPAVLASVRRKENDCLRKWFDGEQQALRIRSGIAFESWLLTVMGTAYFASSNAKTLRNTLGESFFSADARELRSRDLANLFEGKQSNSDE